MNTHHIGWCRWHKWLWNGLQESACYQEIQTRQQGTTVNWMCNRIYPSVTGGQNSLCTSWPAICHSQPTKAIQESWEIIFGWCNEIVLNQLPCESRGMQFSLVTCMNDREAESLVINILHADCYFKKCGSAISDRSLCIDLLKKLYVISLFWYVCRFLRWN